MRTVTPLPRLAYWALDLFAAMTFVALFAVTALMPVAWHRPIDLVWVALFALGLSVWQRYNCAAELAAGAGRNARWHGSPEQRRFDAIYRDDEENS
jgi:hypothetical protein